MANYKPKIISALVLSIFITGCALNNSLRQETDAQHVAKESFVKTKQQDVAEKGMESNRNFVYKAKGKWLGAKSIPLVTETALPDIFYQEWDFKFPGRANISTVAERITLTTDIPVRVKPDAFLPLSRLLPSGAAVAAQATQATDATGNPISNQTFGSVATNVASDTTIDMTMNFHGTLVDFLNRVASRGSLSWEYKNGSIEFFRLVTRNFTLKATSGDSNFASSVGKTGTTQGGNQSTGQAANTATQAAFQSDSSVKMNTQFSVWTSVEAAIRAMISPIGRVSVNQGTGTITVTDAKENVDSIAALIEKENLMLTRQVRVKVEVVNVSLNREYQYGVDWNIVYSRLNSMLNPGWTVNFGTPTSLVGAESGSMGFTIPALNGVSTGNGTIDRLSGSQAMIKALSGIGKVALTNTTNAITVNRQPVPVSLTQQVGYIAATTPAISSVGGTGGVAGLTPGVVTTGYVLNLLPTVLDSGAVLLQFDVDMSELTRLNTVTSGSGASQQSIQTPEVSSMRFLQRAALRPGETLVLAGFERETNQYDKRGLTENAKSMIDGSIAGKGKREAMVIMITPVIEGGV